MKALLLRITMIGFCLLLLSSPAAAQIPGPDTLFAAYNNTHINATSGSWQDPKTWKGGKVPSEAEASRVFIQTGTTVTIHGGAPAGCKWVNVGGKLTVCDHCDVRFNVETIYVPMGGNLDIGTPGRPRTGRVIVEFTPGGFSSDDKGQWSRGLVSMGRVTAAGVPKTEYGVLSAELPVGATSLTLKDVPVGWKPGDELLIATTDDLVGEKQTPFQSEYVTITAPLLASAGSAPLASGGLQSGSGPTQPTAPVDPKTFTFSPPLKYRHRPWYPELKVYVLNLTRNVTFRSRDTSTIASRGHMMFMHHTNYLSYVTQEGLGRTDKSRPTTDPRVVAFGDFVAGSDANPRGRYADHNHRTGPLNGASWRRGTVLRGSPGWLLVNHDSHCEWNNCIALDAFGSAFVTEEGQERGHMRGCIAALCKGRGATVSSSDADHAMALNGLPNGDFGSDGSGFWLHGGLVEVSDCASFDHTGRGYGLFNRTLNGYPRYGSGNPIPEYLRYEIGHDPVLLSQDYAPILAATSYNKIPAGAVPQQVFARNVASFCKLGVQAWASSTHDSSSQLVMPLAVRGNITDLTLWGRGNKLHFEYTRQFNVRGINVYGDSELRGASAPFLSINAEQPIHLRGPEITIWGVNIRGMLNRNDWPKPKPIYADTNNGTDQDNWKIEGTYPVVGGPVSQP
jgi:hypothetical protein